MRALPILALLVPLLFFSCAVVRVKRDLGELLPLEKEHWEISYLGNGKVSFSPPGKLLLSSGVPSAPGVTHAALLLSHRVLPKSGFELEVEYTLLAQLREATPNPWETFWLFFGYQPGKDGKRTNYALVKPNGLEVGRAWGKFDQSFAFTTPVPFLLPNTAARLRVLVPVEGPVEIFFQDKPAGTIPHSALFHHSGRIGLYLEDARVAVREVRVRILGK